MTFAGDIDVREAWELLKSDPSAQLVDVRTSAEWSFVGVPDLTPLGRAVVCVAWQLFPTMERNAEFERSVSERLKAAGARETTPVLFLCRSGARSQVAAIAMAEAGFKRCFNIASGFEGDLNAAKHRGETNGWKAGGLPWVQA